METPSSQLSTEQILSALSHLSLPELEQVFDHVLALQAERKAAHLSTAESTLLTRINQGLPSALRERIACLRGCLKSSGCREPTQHQTRHREVNHRLTALGQPFIIFTQTARLVKPRQGPFYYPAAG